MDKKDIDLNKFKVFIVSYKTGFLEFSHLISLVINSFFLTIIYFFGIGLTSIFAKFSHKTFLNFNTDKNTYWRKLNLTTEEKEKYYRQF